MCPAEAAANAAGKAKDTAADYAGSAADEARQFAGHATDKAQGKPTGVWDSIKNTITGQKGNGAAAGDVVGDTVHDTVQAAKDTAGEHYESAGHIFENYCCWSEKPACCWRQIVLCNMHMGRQGCTEAWRGVTWRSREAWWSSCLLSCAIHHGPVADGCSQQSCWHILLQSVCCSVHSQMLPAATAGHQPMLHMHAHVHIKTAAADVNVQCLSQCDTAKSASQPRRILLRRRAHTRAHT